MPSKPAYGEEIMPLDHAIKVLGIKHGDDWKKMSKDGDTKSLLRTGPDGKAAVRVTPEMRHHRDVVQPHIDEGRQHLAAAAQRASATSLTSNGQNGMKPLSSEGQGLLTKMQTQGAGIDKAELVPSRGAQASFMQGKLVPAAGAQKIDFESPMAADASGEIAMTDPTKGGARYSAPEQGSPDQEDGDAWRLGDEHKFEMAGKKAVGQVSVQPKGTQVEIGKVDEPSVEVPGLSMAVPSKQSAAADNAEAWAKRSEKLKSEDKPVESSAVQPDDFLSGAGLAKHLISHGVEMGAQALAKHTAAKAMGKAAAEKMLGTEAAAGPNKVLSGVEAMREYARAAPTKRIESAGAGEMLRAADWEGKTVGKKVTGKVEMTAKHDAPKLDKSRMREMAKDRN